MKREVFAKFHIRVFEQKTLIWWKNRRSSIDIDPPYQRRGRIWSPADKAYLIDSIINGFDIPKLYIADFTWGDSDLNDKNLPYAIIDGKQRFEAIFDFFFGEIVLNPDFVYRLNTDLRLGGLGYKDLQKNHPLIAEEFENYNLHVMSVYAESREPINSLFVRLNRSKPLTGAEVRNAAGGPAPDLLREISKHEFFVDIVRFATNRAQDMNAAAKLLIFEYHGDLRETKKKNLDKFVESAKNMEEGGMQRLELAARKVMDVLNDMAQIFLPKDKLLGSAGIVPVYYWVIRKLDKLEQSQIRSFLVGFEQERARNRELLKNNPNSEEIDGELVEYDNYNRSTNDQASHEGRVRIILGRFRR